MLEHRPFSAVLFWQFWTFEVAEKITLAKKCQRDTMILLFTSAIRSLFAECWHGLEKLGYKRGYANLFPKENQKIYLAFQLLFKADLILLATKINLHYKFSSYLVDRYLTKEIPMRQCKNADVYVDECTNNQICKLFALAGGTVTPSILMFLKEKQDKKN